MFVWTVSDNMSVKSLLPAHRSSKYNVAHKHGCFSHTEQELQDVNTQETKDPVLILPRCIIINLNI